MEASNDRKPEDVSEKEILHRIDLISLTEICMILGLTLDRDEILNTLTHMTPDIIKAEDAVTVLLARKGRDLVFCYSSSSASEKLKKFKYGYGKGIAEWIIREGKPVLINDVSCDERYGAIIERLMGKHTRNLLCAPIKAKGKLLGALCAINKKDGGSFEPIDLMLCNAITSQAGVAIERARLIEENMRVARLAAVGETVAGLSHCVKGILSVLKGGEYLVQRAMEKDDHTMLEKGWAIMEGGVGRIATLVGDMLMSVRESEPVYSEVSPCGLITDSIEMLKEYAGDKGVELIFIDEPGIGKVSVDKHGIFRCLLNLIKNGIEACYENMGTVTVELKSGPEDNFTIRIADTGCGMDEDTQKSIFTRFFSTKGKKGTGLGLIVVDKIVNEHGGSIEMDSKPGEGTTFYLRLPRQKKQASLPL